MTTIILIGFIQALFFAVLALTKRKKEIADYILAVLFFMLCYQLAVNYIMVSDYKFKFPHFIGTAGPISFLYGPLLFFFVKYYISDKHVFKPIYLLHLLPFFADHIFSAFTFYFQSGGQKIIELNNIINGTPGAEMSVTLISASVSPVLYCIWSIRYLSGHRNNLKKLYSFTSFTLRLEWLWYLTWSMLVVGSLALILNTVIVFFDVADWVQLRLIILVVASFWVFFLGYYSVKKTPFYRSFPIEGINTVNLDRLTKQPEKYEKTRLKDEDIPELKSKLFDFIKQQKPYLNKNLTIGELAESLEIPGYRLSQLINDRLRQSFFEFINNYRVEEVKVRFFDPKYSNLTLSGIALECGFNSKASFYRIFKQLTGQTPTEYIKAKQAA